MKILQILPELNIGGVETGTVDFAKYLTRHGHEAVVVSHGGGLVPELEEAGIKHYTLAVHKKSFWAILKSIKALEKIIRDEKVDIVHARSRVPAWIAFFACRRTKTPFLTTCHGHYGTHFFSRVMSWPKLMVVPSEVIGRHMISDFGVEPQNIRVIPRSVDVEKFDVPRESPASKPELIITIIGRITPLKGHIYFLKAMAKVIRTLPHAKAWIVGDAPAKKSYYREELQVLVRRLGLTDYVEFLGNRRDIPEILAKTDCLVMSSIAEESFGRVILEAQASGVPVVSTKVGGVVEIIDDGTTGLLVLPKDIDEMARCIIKVLKDKKLSENLTLQAKKKIEEKFLLSHMAEKTLTVYGELLKSQNILIIKLSSIGDVVLITASLKAIREKYPHARISCVVGKESREILQRCPYIDELIVDDYKGRDKGLRGLFKVAARLRRLKIDKIIDFQNNRRSHLLAALSFPLESYGYHNKKLGFLLTNRIKDKFGAMSPVSHQFQILRMLNIELKEGTRLELWPSQDHERYAGELLESQWLADYPRIVGINIAASEKWVTKNWPLAHIARLCDILSAKNIRVIITGTQKDQNTVEELVHMTKAKPAVFAGKTDVLQLASLIKRCHAYVTPDSAPMHIAAAVKTPFVALFGPTNAIRHLPPADCFSVLKKDLPCAPCYNARHCKIQTHACMNDITPEEVAREIEKLMRLKR